MSEHGGSGDPDSGLGVPPAGGPDFAGPDFAPPAASGGGQSPIYPPPQDYPPQGYPAQSFSGPPSYPPPAGPQTAMGQQRPTKRPPVALIVIGLLVVAALIATVAVLAVRSIDRSSPTPSPTPPTSAPPSPTPSPSTENRPVTDELGLMMQAKGLTCVQANDDPVINDCESRPSTSFVSIRWILVGQRMAGFHLYAKAKTAADRRQLNDLVRQLHVAGLDPADETKIIKTFPRAKKAGRSIDAHTGWGTVKVQYVDPIDAFQLDAVKSGGRPVHYAGNTFGARPGDIMKRLAGRQFVCKSESYALTCTKDTASLNFYRNGRNSAYNYLDVTPRSRATDDAVLDLLPLLVGTDIQPIESMISTNLESLFFLGAADGYLVQLSSSYLTIECVTW